MLCLLDRLCSNTGLKLPLNWDLLALDSRWYGRGALLAENLEPDADIPSFANDVFRGGVRVGVCSFTGVDSLAA